MVVQCLVETAIRAPLHARAAASAAPREPASDGSSQGGQVCADGTADCAGGGAGGVVFRGAFTKHLNGHGSILSILNGAGPAVGPGLARLG